MPVPAGCSPLSRAVCGRGAGGEGPRLKPRAVCEAFRSRCGDFSRSRPTRGVLPASLLTRSPTKKTSPPPESRGRAGVVRVRAAERLTCVRTMVTYTCDGSGSPAGRRAVKVPTCPGATPKRAKAPLPLLRNTCASPAARLRVVSGHALKKVRKLPAGLAEARVQAGHHVVRVHRRRPVAHHGTRVRPQRLLQVGEARHAALHQVAPQLRIRRRPSGGPPRSAGTPTPRRAWPGRSRRPPRRRTATGPRASSR